MSGKEENVVTEGRPDRHMWLSVSNSLLPSRLRERIVSRRDEHLREVGSDPTPADADPGSGLCGELREFNPRDN